jgi:hypothetical protein
MIELIDAGGHSLDKEATSICQPDSTSIALEKNDAKLVFKGLYSSAYAGLANSEGAGGVPKTEMPGDR